MYCSCILTCFLCLTTKYKTVRRIAAITASTNIPPTIEPIMIPIKAPVCKLLGCSGTVPTVVCGGDDGVSYESVLVTSDSIFTGTSAVSICKLTFKIEPLIARITNVC